MERSKTSSRHVERVLHTGKGEARAQEEKNVCTCEKYRLFSDPFFEDFTTHLDSGDLT